MSKSLKKMQSHLAGYNPIYVKRIELLINSNSYMFSASLIPFFCSALIMPDAD